MNYHCNCPLMAVMSSFAVLAYLLGAVPNGFLIAKAKGIDIRTVAPPMCIAR